MNMTTATTIPESAHPGAPTTYGKLGLTPTGGQRAGGEKHFGLYVSVAKDATETIWLEGDEARVDATYDAARDAIILTPAETGRRLSGGTNPGATALHTTFPVTLRDAARLPNVALKPHATTVRCEGNTLVIAVPAVMRRAAAEAASQAMREQPRAAQPVLPAITAVADAVAALKAASDGLRAAMLLAADAGLNVRLTLADDGKGVVASLEV